MTMAFLQTCQLSALLKSPFAAASTGRTVRIRLAMIFAVFKIPSEIPQISLGQSLTNPSQPSLESQLGAALGAFQPRKKAPEGHD